jgi:hypothetical protein
LPARRPDLRAQAAEFADQTSDLLNRTVTHGIRIRPVLQADRQVCWIGYEINKHTLSPPRGIPLTLTTATPQCYLNVAYTLEQHQGFLVVSESTFGLYLDEDLEENVFHFDYVREPDNEYPLAHVQVSGTSAVFDELCLRLGQEKELSRLHFPVGGKRFRTCLEDVIEMLIVERLVAPRDDWRSAVEQHRSRFHRIQLMAAVRRDPEAAREQLRMLAEDE